MRFFVSALLLLLSITSFSSAALNYQYYIDDNNGCMLPIFEGWSYQKGSGNVQLITESSEGYKIILDIYDDQESFVPELSRRDNNPIKIVEKIKQVLPKLSKDYSYNTHKIIRESGDGSDESIHIQLFWSKKGSEEALLIQDVICNQGKWYVINFHFPSLRGQLSEIVDTYLQTTLAVFLTDLDTRHIYREYSAIVKMYKELGLPPIKLSAPEYPNQEMRMNSISLQ